MVNITGLNTQIQLLY